MDQGYGRPERNSSISTHLSPAPQSKTARNNSIGGLEVGEESGGLFEKRSASDDPVANPASVRRQVRSPRLKKYSEEHPNHIGRRERHKSREPSVSSSSDVNIVKPRTGSRRGRPKKKAAEEGDSEQSSNDTTAVDDSTNKTWSRKKAAILRNLPPGVDEAAAKQILNDIVVQGDEVHWSDIAGLEIAKNALRETVVYPFLRPDLFMGLREPARGMLLFGPPGTGKTMLARAVATESKSTFFSISASSLTSKYLGESEKLVKALFGLARALAPSIIFVDEIDSLLSQRTGSGEHEATRRIKTEFLIQWSDLQRAAAGREVSERDKERGDANRVLVLAATNLPWAIDEAARRRFVRRQYIPLPEPTTRETQLRTLLGQQKHNLSASDIEKLVGLTAGRCYIQIAELFVRNASLTCTLS
jgi:SpoVK/Ycf46/Vps4 family AAA+-type ATPase